MDLIATLSSQLGIEPSKAQGLAGAALGMLERHVSAKLGAAEAEELRAGVPELPAWQREAEALRPGTTGGFLGAAGGLLGAVGAGGSSGFDVAALIQIAAKAGVPAQAAQSLLPLLLQFLQSRVSPDLIGKLLRVLPALKGGGSSGGLLGALGSILGG